jgi:hypothetical protein
LEAAVSPPLTDLYQMNMIEAYLDHGDIFEVFVPSLPPFMVAALAVTGQRRAKLQNEPNLKPALATA